MANTEIGSIEQVFAAIESAIKARFPEFKCVEFHRQDRAASPLPACLLELSEFTGANDIDPGTGQQAVNARFEARIQISFRKKNPQIEIRDLATRFAAFVRLNRFGCRIGPAQLIGGWPDDYEPKQDNIEAWRIEWEQAVHLGEQDESVRD